MASRVDSTTLTLINKCNCTVWPGILSNEGTAEISTTGGSNTHCSDPWSGRVWARTLCSKDSAGQFSCLTRDCSSDTIECEGSGTAPSAALVDFTLNGYDGLEYYDINLVDGYNLPIRSCQLIEQRVILRAVGAHRS